MEAEQSEVEAIEEQEAEMPLPIVTVNTQYTAALVDLQKKKSLLTKRSSKMNIFETTSQDVVKATTEIAKEVEELEPVSEDRERAGKQLVEIKVSLSFQGNETVTLKSYLKLSSIEKLR